MKVKLLKKVRKRFSITHYPNGIRIIDDFYDYNIFRLTDKNNEYFVKSCELIVNPKRLTRFTDYRYNTKQECINFLLTKVIEKLRSDYPSLGAKGYYRIRSTKVWYNG